MLLASITTERRLGVLLSFVLLALSSLASAERVFDDLWFTESKCKELGGYDNDFEACAVIEFCIGTDDSSSRLLRRRGLEEWTDEEESLSGVVVVATNQADEEFFTEVGEAEAATKIEQQDTTKGHSSGLASHNQTVPSDMTPSSLSHSPPLPHAKHSPPHAQQHSPPNNHDASSPSTPNNHQQQSATKQQPPKKIASSSSEYNAQFGWRIQGSTDCLYPGPIMRLKRGVKHGLFVQGGGVATNIHFHGLHIAGHGNGDDMHRSVEGAGNTLIYELNLPADKHHGGTHWYHSHVHGDSWDQVKGGAFGMLVIDENANDVGTTDENVLGFLENEKIMILDNTKGAKDWRVNGIDGEETYSFVKNEWYRMRILATNVGSHSDQEHVVFPDSCTVRPIAHDGIFRFSVPGGSKTEFTLTSSSRLDVAIQCSGDGDILVRRSPVASIQVDATTPASSVAPFEGGGTSSWKSSRLEYTKDLRDIEPDNQWTVRVDETNINGISTSKNKPLCDSDGNDFQYGTVQEWEIRGASAHPFHVHMYPMQVANGDCGDGHEAGEYYDTIVTDDPMDHCKVRLNLVDIAGPTTVHCHIFEHADHGALTWLNVEGGPVQTGPTCVKGCVEAEERPKCSSDRRRQLRAGHPQH